MSTVGLSETSPRRGAWSIGTTLIGVVGLVMAAGWAWHGAWPALGERPFAAPRVWAAWSAALAFWAAGHALLFGIGVPLVYRRRGVYLGIAAICGLLAVLAGITAAALYAAAVDIR